MRHPWEMASTSHLVHRMSDAELAAAIEAACATPRTRPYLSHMLAVTQRRRETMPHEENMRLLGIVAAAERRAILAEREKAATARDSA